MMYCLYFIQSEKDLGLYIGVTTNLKRRLQEHNLGISKSTKPRRPFRLIYFETYDTKEGAYKREFFLKSPKGYKEKLEILRKVGPKGGLRPSVG